MSRPKYKIQPYPHQLHAIEMGKKLDDLGLLWDMGCVTGDTIINCNRSGAGFKITLRDLFIKFNGGRWDKSIPTKVRSCVGDRIRLHTIRDVVYQGAKLTYKLTLEDGKSIRATDNHEFMTQRGWVRLRDLQKTDSIMVDTLYPIKTKLNKPKIRYSLVSVINHPHARKTKHKRNDRYDKIYTLWHIEKHRVIAEAHLNGITYDSFVKKVRLGDVDGLKFIDPKLFHVHHKNKDNKDNRISNLEILPVRVHQKLHGDYSSLGQGEFKFSRIIKKVKFKVEKVYDIVCDDPHRNFVANGMVIHNSGKTAGTIHILRERFSQQKRMMRTLILSPLVTLFNWKREFEMHSYIDPSKIIVLYKGGTQGKMRTFLKHTQNPVTGLIEGDYIFITNYETLQTKAFTDIMLAWNPEIIVADEAHLLKNHSAIRTKAATKLADHAKHKIVLTGTPILNSIKDIYSVFRFLDKGKTFGVSYHVFTKKYMQDENAGWSSKPGYFPKLVARPESYDEITNLIYTKCHRVLKKDVMKDLPPLIKTVRYVELSAEQKKYYKEMERDFITFVKDKMTGQTSAIVAQVAVTKALRLQQLVSGFVTNDTSEVITISDNPRLELLAQLLQEIVIDEKAKCILWCSFRHDYKQLSKVCAKMGIEHVFLTGEMNLNEKQEAMDSFNSSDSCRVIIANRRAGGIGINLVAASYSVVYSRNFSLGDELQSEARNHRGGSQIHEQIIKIDLCAKDTIDENILEALRNKEDISKKVIDFVKHNIGVTR